MRVNKELSKGSHEIMILNMFSRKDMYGYELIQEMEALSGGVFSMSQGSLYPVLHSMELAGWITSYWEVYDGRKRKYYHLTEAGKSAAAKKASEWRGFTAAVDSVMGGRLNGGRGE